MTTSQVTETVTPARFRHSRESGNPEVKPLAWFMPLMRDRFEMTCRKEYDNIESNRNRHSRESRNPAPKDSNLRVAKVDPMLSAPCCHPQVDCGTPCGEPQR